jgi:hypothetical protein
MLSQHLLLGMYRPFSPLAVPKPSDLLLLHESLGKVQLTVDPEGTE